MIAMLCDKCGDRVTSWLAYTDPDLARGPDGLQMRLVVTLSMPDVLPAQQPHLCVECTRTLLEQMCKEGETYVPAQAAPVHA